MDNLIPQIISNICLGIKCQTFPTKPFHLTFGQVVKWGKFVVVSRLPNCMPRTMQTEYEANLFALALLEDPDNLNVKMTEITPYLLQNIVEDSVKRV